MGNAKSPRFPLLSTASRLPWVSMNPEEGGHSLQAQMSLTFFILSYEFAWMLYSQASNAYHSKIRLCTSYTGMYVSMKVKVVLSYQLVQLTLREDAQPQGWARPSDLDLGTCRRRSTCKKHLPEPQDLPRGWFCVPDYLLRTGGQVGLKQLKPHWYISFLSNSQWSPPSLT